MTGAGAGAPAGPRAAHAAAPGPSHAHSPRTTVSVSVPATSANLGPGFDALGLALGVRDVVAVSLTPEGVQVEASGAGADTVPNGERNLVVRAAHAVARRAGRQLPGLAVRMRLGIPVGRGLGSSAAAVIAGAVAANTLLGEPLDRDALLQVAVRIEGHPDNVAPALLGGICAACPASDGGVHVVRLAPPAGLWAVAAVPDRALSTREARRALPPQVPFADAVANVQRTAVLVAALASGSGAGAERLLADASRDRLHQPYRARLVPGMGAAIEAARGAGAAAAFLSGAGPTVLALVARRELAPAVGRAACAAFAAEGVGAEPRVLDLEAGGARLVS